MPSLPLTAVLTPKPQNYVDFAGSKLWFVGYASDRALEETGPRTCVVTDEKGVLATVMSDQLRVWMGPREDKDWLKEVYDELNKAVHIPGLHALGVPELQRIRDIAGKGLGYVQ